jgi:hypothetical protein
MVLTKDELVGSLKHEVRILVHLASKVDPAKIDYRPTTKQRSILELLQVHDDHGSHTDCCNQGRSLQSPGFERRLGPAEAAAKAMNFDQAVSAIRKLSDEYARHLSEWTEADFRSEIDVFGRASTRGRQLVNLVLNGHAAYRTQLFCYLKSCGREELSTMNLWAGVDAA